MRWRTEKRGLLGRITGAAENFEDIGRIAQETGITAARSAVVEVAREVLVQAGLPAGPHVWNDRGEWLDLREGWRNLSSKELMASLPPAFITARVDVAVCPVPSCAQKLSAEFFAAEVVNADYWLSCHLEAGNLEGVTEWAFKLGEKSATLRTVLAGWHIAAERGDKELKVSSMGGHKANPHAVEQHAAWRRRDAELAAEGHRRGRIGKIAKEFGVEYEAVKKALQRARKKQK